MKKIIITLLLSVLLTSCNLSTENKIFEGKNNVSDRDKAIEEYLLSQRRFSWEDEPFTKRVCLFENIWNKDDIFPLSLRVICSWYRNGEETSWISIPVLLDYPNELSYYDINKFTNSIPFDWNWYSPSIKNIFPKEVQEKIFNWNVWGDLSIKMEKIISWQYDYDENSKVKINKKNKSNELISKESWYYYKSIIAEEKEFSFHNTLENNDFLFKQGTEINKKYIRWDRPICPWMPNKESCIKEWYWNIFNRYVIWKNTYDLIWDFQNQDKYYIFKNDKLIFEDTIEMVWAWSRYMTYELDNKLLFIYTKNRWDNTVLYNVFYNEENINKKYKLENIDWYFRYKWKEWFIVNKTKIFYNWKLLPYSFDFIQNRACCTSPSLFELYDNWMLVFANKRGNNVDDLEFDLIEVNLNNFLPSKINVD